MKLPSLFVVMALSLITTPGFGAPPDGIGIVKSVVGDVAVVRKGQSLKATPRLMLFEEDVVKTGGGGKAGLVLNDDTVISLGHHSTLALTRFRFDPQEKNFSLLAQLLQGTISFLSGQIAKLAPNSVRILTPQAAIGVRGSHVLIKVD